MPDIGGEMVMHMGKRRKFDGTYYKHQKGEHAASLIAGVSAMHAFIQVITNEESYYFQYPLSVHGPRRTVRIGKNIFSKDGVKINIEEKGASIFGEIKYAELTPLRYDIMGPFRYLPMQCRHSVVSLWHRLEGSLSVNGESIDFTGGTGYIEGDSGTSFPRSYAWIQCNDFQGKTCVMASVADIPFAGLRFRGCICVVYIHGVEYRLATYLGVKILLCNENQIVLKQGTLRLEIEIDAGAGHRLVAPKAGEMVREIRERIVCGARFRFMKDGEVLLDQRTDKASFEYVEG